MKWKCLFPIASPNAESITAIWLSSHNGYADFSSCGKPALAASYLAADAVQKRQLIQWIADHADEATLIDESLYTLAPSVPCPGKVVCLGKSYADHAREFDGSAPTEPSIFLKATTAVAGAFSPVLIPPGCSRLDYEVELAIVIGEKLKNADSIQAAQAIAGYTMMCDYSERDLQLNRGGQWTKGKSYDTFAPLGPTFVTPDELTDPDNLPIFLKVNGESRQAGNTNQLIMPMAELVSYVSSFMTLLPGDVISTGTPVGVAIGMDPPQFLQPGDIVEWGTPSIGFARQIVEQDTTAS